MAMRLELTFPAPLSSEQRIVLHVAIASLAKSTRIRWHADGRGARVIGEAMSRERVREALDEATLGMATIESSLDEDENADADDTEVTSGKERIRPIGR